MNARRILLLVGAALVVAIAPAATAAESAATAKTAGARLADAGVKAEVGAGYADAKRYTFTFEGYKAYFDEPVEAKPGRQWMWCMKWPGAFAEFTGQVDCVRRGYFYVYLDDIKVFKRDMYGHHPHGFQGAENVGAIVDFFEGKPVSIK